MIDGFIKGPQKVRHKIVSSQVHRRAEKAQTLMRGGLKKPAGKLNATVAHFGGSLNPQREIRAKSTPRHHNVQHFGIPKSSPKTDHSVKAISGEVVSRPSKGRDAHQTTAPLPSMVASASHQKLERLLDQALTHADTHKEAIRYHAARHFWQRRWLRGKRLWAVLAVATVAVVGVVIFSWQKVPALSVKTAGLQAHLSPTVPAYKPDGYHLAGPAKAISGTVSIRFASSNDSSLTYEIIEAGSNLTSSLVGQSVVPKGAAVQTSQVDGNTVYIYGQGNDAAWVNNGVLYTVKDHANLTSNELIKIVQGLNP